MKQLKNKKFGEFNGHVFLIKISSRGEDIHLQTGGCGCYHRHVKGFVFTKFVSSISWFQPDWWYKNFTVWGSEYPKKIFFQCSYPDNNLLKLKTNRFFKGENRYKNKSFEEILDLSRKQAEEDNKFIASYCRSAQDILFDILKAASYHLNENVEPSFNNYDYGVNWEEAYIPVTIKGHKYVLAWENCD